MVCKYVWNVPELARSLLRIRQLDEGRQDFFDNPRSLVFVVCKDLCYLSVHI